MELTIKLDLKQLELLRDAMLHGRDAQMRKHVSKYHRKQKGG